MSVKQKLHAAVEALPESLTIEEAVERLYRAFKLKQAAAGAENAELLRALEEGEADIAAGRVKPHSEILSKYQAWLDGGP